ncbi:hypothetical protein HPB50_014508 [Hyalomma asiaticum]|uniref:Uncharacterized protein n=1 Tax=Hyalomma asiaticum TaxID=266040 RepID=A0ACB7SL63_HYAAI|nr:hypothetical protein HPB50_014508 [Hyalomma asiaticum]
MAESAAGFPAYGYGRGGYPGYPGFGYPFAGMNLNMQHLCLPCPPLDPLNLYNLHSMQLI